MAKYEPDKQVNGLRKYDNRGYYLHYEDVLNVTNSSYRDKRIASLDTPINVVRNKAKQLLGEVASGIDPFETSTGLTVNDLFHDYLEDCRSRKVKGAMNNGINKDKPSDIENIYNRHIKPTIGRKNAKNIQRGDIKILHRNISKDYKYQSNRVVELLCAIYNNAISSDLVDTNPATHIRKNQEEERDRYLTKKELGKIVEELNLKAKEQDGKWSKSISFIWLSILTGARKGELASAKWTDLKDNKITLKKHKTDKSGQPRTIYLSTQALNIVNKLKRDSEYIIGVKDPKKLWRGVRERAGCPDLHYHDLRHAFGTFAFDALRNDKLGGNLMGHADRKSFDRYQKVLPETAQESSQVVGDYIQKLWMEG